MPSLQASQRRKKGKKPLDRQALEQMALAYVARYATSSAKLVAYLKRKIRERGWLDDEPPSDPEALAERYVELGYIDDAAFARIRQDGLLRRGYGKRRVDQALGAAGIDEGLREEISPGEAARRHALLAFMKRRRFGPFATEPPDREKREKQLAAMLRAGHSLDDARELADLDTPKAAEEWAHELDDDCYED
mgnify:CR=1 FL=1